MPALNELMELRPSSPPDDDELEITGSDPVLETKFRLAETAAAALASVGVAVNDLWELKTGQRQSIAINSRAATASLCSNKYLQLQNEDGGFDDVIDSNHEANRALTGMYLTKDGRWVLPHFGLNNLRERMLSLLNADADKQSIAKAVK